MLCMVAKQCNSSINVNLHVHGVAWQPFNAAALLAVLQNILVSKQQKQKSCCQVFGVLNILFGILQFCKIVQELNKAYTISSMHAP